jgi:hypothetical protein
VADGQVQGNKQSITTSSSLSHRLARALSQRDRFRFESLPLADPETRWKKVKDSRFEADFELWIVCPSDGFTMELVAAPWLANLCSRAARRSCLCKQHQISRNLQRPSLRHTWMTLTKSSPKWLKLLALRKR